MSAAAVERAFREEWPAVVATLARRLHDLQLAEDAAQEAFAAAAATWPRDGVPPKPGAWLTVTAWRKAIDQLRRDRLLAERARALQAMDITREDLEKYEETLGMEDDRLRLIFACCHPALALEVRVALTLRYLAGLRTREIANAFLVPEPTMAKRLGCPLPMPSDRGWRRFTASSISCSMRDTQPPAEISWSGPSCAARPSGWDDCCTACCRTTPRQPLSSRSCCCTTQGRTFGRIGTAVRCLSRSKTERAGTTR